VKQLLHLLWWSIKELVNIRRLLKSSLVLISRLNEAVRSSGNGCQQRHKNGQSLLGESILKRRRKNPYLRHKTNTGKGVEVALRAEG